MKKTRAVRRVLSTVLSVVSLRDLWSPHRSFTGRYECIEIFEPQQVLDIYGRALIKEPSKRRHSLFLLIFSRTKFLFLEKLQKFILANKRESPNKTIPYYIYMKTIQEF